MKSVSAREVFVGQIGVAGLTPCHEIAADAIVAERLDALADGHQPVIVQH
jgi:hypothetical protein